MKWPFSYKTDLFLPSFIFSAVTHFSLLGISRFFVSPPQYAVRQAPVSIEMVMIRELPPVEIKEPIQEEKVISAPETQSEIFAVREEEESKEIPQEQPLEVARGAIVEATPLTGIDNPTPIYPHMARRNGWEGLVLLKVLVERDGMPSRVIVAEGSGYSVLDEAAVTAVKNWQFVAAQKKNIRFSSWIDIPIRFKLKNK